MPHTSSFRIAAAVLVAALLAVTFASAREAGAAQVPTQQASLAAADGMPVIAISPMLCLMLVGARPGHTADALSCLNLDRDAAGLSRIADLAGDGDDIVEPSDFAAIDVDANQIHQMDDFDVFSQTQSASGSLYILTFVPDHAPVQFRTNRGVFIPPGTGVNAADPVGQVYNCDTMRGAEVFPEDDDCDPNATTGDGVVVARLRARYGDIIADLGVGTVSVTQGTEAGSVDFRVVGEPATVELSAVESKIQDGVTLPTLTPPAPGGAPPARRRSAPSSPPW